MLALGGITLIGTALWFATLDLQSFWNDEVFSAWYVARPFREMLHGVRTTESNPPGYYVVAWLWAKVFGTREVGIRSLSALAGTLLIPTTYATAATLVSRRAGLLAAALAATSPILVWYSQEARSYSLMVLASGVAMLFFARAVRMWRAIDLLSLGSLFEPRRRGLGAPARALGGARGRASSRRLARASRLGTVQG
jgi:mannosyltransferase